MIELIDTHSHLDAGEFEPDRDTVYARAQAAGVSLQVVPAVTQGNFIDVEATCHRYPGCLPAWGMHPMYIHVHHDSHLELLRRAIEAWRPVAVGEIGLDLFVDGLDFPTQEHFYVEQLKIARDYDLPVLLHCRRANDQILKYLRRIQVRGGIAHAFSGSRHQAEEYIKQGFFGGVLNTLWPFLKPQEALPKLKSLKRAKVDGEELLVQRYHLPGSRGAELFFDPVTFRHVATRCRLEVIRRTSSSVWDKKDRVTLREKFSDFAEFDGMQLPTSWTITLELPRDTSHWEIAFDTVRHTEGPELKRSARW